MVVIGGFLLGVLMGALSAIRRKGKIADIAQYAIGYGVAFGLTAWILAILLERLLG